LAHVRVGEPALASPGHASVVGLSLIFPENRHPLFGIMLFSRLRMILSENRWPLFGIMR
jgi:hypothetical protein